MADAKVKKAKGKAKSTATTTKWTEVANSSTSAYYISPKEYNLKIDNEGYYYLTVKLVPFKHSLESQRQEFAERFKNPKLTKYTHSLNLYKIDELALRKTLSEYGIIVHDLDISSSIPDKVTSLTYSVKTPDALDLIGLTEKIAKFEGVIEVSVLRK